MKTLLMTTVLSALLSHGENTVPVVKPKAQPEKCPGIAMMAWVGLDHVTPFPEMGWIGVKENSSYDTGDKWTFMILNFRGESNGKNAIQQLSKDIGTLQLKGEPLWDEKFGKYICFYEDEAKEIIAGAITPVMYE